MYYYIDSQNQQRGPVPASSLVNHGVTLESYVWKAGMQNWAKAKNIPELQTVLCSTLPQQKSKSSQNLNANYSKRQSSNYSTTISQQRRKPSHGVFANFAKQYLRNVVVTACSAGAAYCFSMWAMHDFNASYAEYAVGGIILSIIGFVFHKFEHKILKRLGLY